MWVIGKIRESVESIPLELSHYMVKSEEDLLLSSKTSLTHNLHNNILTPDKIPEFCLPPKLCRRSPLLEAETVSPYLSGLNRISKSSASSNATQVNSKELKTKNSDASAAKKPLPFSAEVYGLAGIYESPNTRRKESLFHSKCPVNLFDRRIPDTAPRLVKETNLPKKGFGSGFLPLFLSKSPSETGSTRQTKSSGDSSPLSSPVSAKSSLCIPPGSGCLKGATSCPSLIESREDRGRWRRGGLSLSSLTLAPPVLFPKDALQHRDRLHREHVLPLQGRGKVSLFTEHTTFSTNTSSSSLFTVRVHVVSVEGLLADSDQRALNCAVNLCLTPGKLQQQESVTIQNCCSPLFNEDFFFTELSRDDLLELKLKLKVVTKPAAGALRRGTVMGVTTIPLSQLRPLTKG